VITAKQMVVLTEVDLFQLKVQVHTLETLTFIFYLLELVI